MDLYGVFATLLKVDSLGSVLGGFDRNPDFNPLGLGQDTLGFFFVFFGNHKETTR